MDFNHGKLTQLDYLYPNENNNVRLTECGGFFEPGGALGCAGQKFEDAQCCFEEASCYAAFIVCLAYRTLDCLINDCQ